ncbi:hypothetical protein, partial [Salmonella enterica]|uniref:hypothetical protein n=1 Tax=Salmonella enterica TaxID=28901 RepID=UPI002FCD9FC2
DETWRVLAKESGENRRVSIARIGANSPIEGFVARRARKDETWRVLAKESGENRRVSIARIGANSPIEGFVA